MKDQGFIGRHPRLTLILAGLVTFLAAAGAVEGVLKAFFPYTVATIGHQHARNAQFYGWGFDPGEGYLNENPDTGEIHYGLLNNHGWRDRDREFAKPPGTYRVLVLGDSVTFGAIVPAEKVYTRLLEDRLVVEGYKVEVLNMAIPGWGTDTQLEALRREGVRYQPDLVILQFTDNDLSDNQSLGIWRKRKPILHDLDGEGRLVRTENPEFTGEYWSFRQRREAFLNTFEIYKRLRGVYLGLRHRLGAGHELAPVQVDHIIHEMGPGHEGFATALRERIGQETSPEALTALAAEHGLAEQEEIILRLAEKRHFHGLWPGYRVGAKVDPGGLEWLLLTRLLEEVKKTTDNIGAELAVISERDEGLFAWAVYWRLFEDTPEAKALFLAMTDQVRRIAESLGVAFIDTPRPISRARNDQHPNLAGNQTLADTLHDWLIETHGGALPR